MFVRNESNMSMVGLIELHSLNKIRPRKLDNTKALSPATWRVDNAVVVKAKNKMVKEEMKEIKRPGGKK